MSLFRRTKLVYGEDITTRMAKVKKVHHALEKATPIETSEDSPPKPNRVARHARAVGIRSFTRRIKRHARRIARLKAIVDDSVTVAYPNGKTKTLPGYQPLSGPSSHSRFKAS